MGRTTRQYRYCDNTKKRKENYVGGETPPTSIKEKETLWSKVPYVYPHQVREGREACLENPASGFHTSAGAKNQTHPPTRPKQRHEPEQQLARLCQAESLLHAEKPLTLSLRIHYYKVASRL